MKHKKKKEKKSKKEKKNKAKERKASGEDDTSDGSVVNHLALFTALLFFKLLFKKNNSENVLHSVLGFRG